MRLLSLFCLISISVFAQPYPDSLYHKFTKTYDELDAAKIGNLYTEHAETLNLYDGSNPNSHKGRANIEQYFRKFFDNVKSKNQRLILTFKIIHRKKEGDHLLDNGFYRLEVTTPNKPSSFGFGKFSTVLQQENGKWKFKTDATTNTDFVEYENAVNTTIPIREELLYAPFYDNFLGNYSTEKNEVILIGRSQTRLYAYFEADNKYRGLNKINANTWTLGDKIISAKETQTFKFYPEKVEIFEKDKLALTGTKNYFYTTENVQFNNKKGIELGGTIFKPKKVNGKALVLVHGSGPQDRNGYASIIRLLADALAKEGTTVLTYDKQGVGASSGNYESQNFADFAQDALAGIDLLKTKYGVSLSKIGLGGSSQAGWIIAKAIEQSEYVDFAITVGAAGSGVSVKEQNLYNTEVLMKCTRTFSDNQISNAISQQRHFFSFLEDPKSAQNLDEFTSKIQKDTLIRDWLFPTSNLVDFTNRNQWYTALEIGFDPLPIWKNYKKPVLMTFSEFDDSTPTAKVKAKINALNNTEIQTITFKNAQHLGLETYSICKNDIAELDRFHPEFFKTIQEWINTF
jgi:pimeloyl-ACP methyl ester carboxylesterase/ketosteroid isomerase-like protein